MTPCCRPGECGWPECPQGHGQVSEELRGVVQAHFDAHRDHLDEPPPRTDLARRLERIVFAASSHRVYVPCEVE